MKWYVYFLLSFCLFSAIVKGEPSIELKKVYFHQNNPTVTQSPSDSQHIELGNLVFYFGQKPYIENSVVVKGDKTLQILFLPHVLVSPELNDSLQQLNKSTKDLMYTVQCTPKAHPRKGLEITLVYPTDKIGVSYDHFSSISLQEGVTLRLYNKDLIQRIKEVNKSIITTAYLDTPRVFVDCGHGGSDAGATCYAVQEKDISLGVGLRLAKLLKNNGVQVGLSRDTDVTVALDQRTRLAHEQRADLFVSIHANAAINKTQSGIETYCLDSSLFSQGDSCLTDSEQHQVKNVLSERCNKSYVLAQHVHETLIKTVSSE